MHEPSTGRALVLMEPERKDEWLRQCQAHAIEGVAFRKAVGGKGT